MRKHYQNPDAKTLERVEYIRQNPELTGNQLAKDLKISYFTVFRLSQCFDVPFKKLAKSGRYSKTEQGESEFFNPNIYHGDYTCII